MTQETIEVPKESFIQSMLALAYECEVDMPDTTGHGPRGEGDHELDYNLSDIEWEECDILDDQTVVALGRLEADYSVKTARARYNPPGKAHPAEYENHTREIGVDLTIEFEDLPRATLYGEQL